MHQKVCFATSLKGIEAELNDVEYMVIHSLKYNTCTCNIKCTVCWIHQETTGYTYMFVKLQQINIINTITQVYIATYKYRNTYNNKLITIHTLKLKRFCIHRK